MPLVALERREAAPADWFLLSDRHLTRSLQTQNRQKLATFRRFVFCLIARCADLEPNLHVFPTYKMRMWRPSSASREAGICTTTTTMTMTTTTTRGITSCAEPSRLRAAPKSLTKRRRVRCVLFPHIICELCLCAATTAPPQRTRPPQHRSHRTRLCHVSAHAQAPFRHR